MPLNGLVQRVPNADLQVIDLVTVRAIAAASCRVAAAEPDGRQGRLEAPETVTALRLWLCGQQAAIVTASDDEEGDACDEKQGAEPQRVRELWAATPARAVQDRNAFETNTSQAHLTR